MLGGFTIPGQPGTCSPGAGSGIQPETPRPPPPRGARAFKTHRCHPRAARGQISWCEPCPPLTPALMDPGPHRKASWEMGFGIPVPIVRDTHRDVLGTESSVSPAVISTSTPLKSLLSVTGPPFAYLLEVQPQCPHHLSVMGRRFLPFWGIKLSVSTYLYCCQKYLVVSWTGGFSVSLGDEVCQEEASSTCPPG